MVNNRAKLEKKKKVFQKHEAMETVTCKCMEVEAAISLYSNIVTKRKESYIYFRTVGLSNVARGL